MKLHLLAGQAARLRLRSGFAFPVPILRSLDHCCQMRRGSGIRVRALGWVGQKERSWGRSQKVKVGADRAYSAILQLALLFAGFRPKMIGFF